MYTAALLFTPGRLPRDGAEGSLCLVRPAPPPPPEHRRLFALELPVRILEMRVAVFPGRGTGQGRRESHVLLARFPRAGRTVALRAGSFLLPIDVGTTDPTPAFVSQPGLGDTLGYLRNRSEC